MILYFDNYITDAPLFKYLYDDLAELRARSKIYAAPSKVDVTLYTLASYAAYPWSGVLIKYELEDKGKNAYFEKEVRKLFPKAVIIGERSDSQKKYQEACRLLEKMGDEWVFYAGNNDHPFVCSDLSIIGKCLAKAEEMARANQYVSVWYSHIHEGAGLIASGNFQKLLPEIVRGKKIICEDGEVVVCRNEEDGDFNSILIVNMKLLKHWFFSKDFGGKRIRRADDLKGELKTEGQIMIYPKRHICDHFDGYSTISSKVGADLNSIVPPLFVPPGFFENDIKIAFGYPEYREGYVNINPAKSNYSFEGRGGADLRIGLDDLPLFWKGRISKVDVNPKIDREKLEELGNRNLRKMCYPWPSSARDYYLRKFAMAPAWRARKLVHRTRIYFEDPEFLRETKDQGGWPLRIYKNAIFRLVGLMARPKKKVD